MKSQKQQYLELAIKCLETKRKEYIANAFVDVAVFDFQQRAKEHYQEYTEAIDYLKGLYNENVDDRTK